MSPHAPDATEPDATEPDAQIASGSPGRQRVTHPDARRASRRWWDAHAEEYYEEHGTFLGDDDLCWGPEGWSEEDLGLLAEVLRRPQLDVLEVGAGAAQGSRYLQARGARVVATDLSAGMLAQAQRIDAKRARTAGGTTAVPPAPAGEPTGRVPEHPTSQPEDPTSQAAGQADEDSLRPVPLVQCDGCELPFADSCLDLVLTAYGVLPFVADAPGFFAECARVLRPGGQVIAAEPHPIRWCFLDLPDEDGLQATIPYWDRWAYVEHDAAGGLEYVETHTTLGERLGQIVKAGLVVTALHEPTWPEHNADIWGGWSPLRGHILPGTAIWIARRP